MIVPNFKKPKSPNFSSGPTKKPDEWSVNKLNTSFLGRYGPFLSFLRMNVAKFWLKSSKKCKFTV